MEGRKGRIQGTRKRRNGDIKDKLEEGNEMEETNNLGREAVGEVEDVKREKRRK